MTIFVRPIALLVLATLLIHTSTASAKPKRPNPPPPSNLPYDVLWALASRAPNDPDGNSNLPGACRRLLGPPRKDTYKRKYCKSEVVNSWVPTLKGPRYVDVRFEVKATITASRIAGLELQVLSVGTLKPTIKSIDFVLSVAGRPGATPIPLYIGAPTDTVTCPGFTSFPMPPTLLRPIGNLTLTDALVLGVRITVMNSTVEKRNMLPSISAVGLQVLRKSPPPPQS